MGGALVCVDVELVILKSIVTGELWFVGWMMYLNKRLLVIYGVFIVVMIGVAVNDTTRSYTNTRRRFRNFFYHSGWVGGDV